MPAVILRNAATSSEMGSLTVLEVPTWVRLAYGASWRWLPNMEKASTALLRPQLLTLPGKGAVI